MAFDQKTLKKKCNIAMEKELQLKAMSSGRSRTSQKEKKKTI